MYESMNTQISKIPSLKLNICQEQFNELFYNLYCINLTTQQLFTPANKHLENSRMLCLITRCKI